MGYPATGKGWHTAALPKGAGASPGGRERQEGLLPWQALSQILVWTLPRVTEESRDGSVNVEVTQRWVTAVP